MRSDPQYAEFEQFQLFKSLLAKTGPLDKHHHDGHHGHHGRHAQCSCHGHGHHGVPHNLSNPTFMQATEVAGYLGKQFPSVGNPAPMGLGGFALTTFVLSMYNVGADVYSSGPQGVVMGLALFYGGFIQMLAGMWELRVGNTFGATAFASYGGFWMSLAALHIKAFGFLDGYAAYPPSYLNNALGIYLFAWCLFSLLMTVASHRTTGVLFSLFATVALTFLLLSIGHWAESSRVTQAGGGVGIIAAAIAWYAMLAGLLTRANSNFVLPVWPLMKEADMANMANSSPVPPTAGATNGNANGNKMNGGVQLSQV